MSRAGDTGDTGIDTGIDTGASLADTHDTGKGLARTYAQNTHVQACIKTLRACVAITRITRILSDLLGPMTGWPVSITRINRIGV